MPLTTEQLEARRHRLGGSDAAAALGLSPWRTPLDVYLAKTTGEQPPVNAEAAYWGNIHEENIAAEFARRTGLSVHRVNKPVLVPELPWAVANLDRRVVGEPALLECKFVTEFNRDGWGESETDQIPEHYLIQVCHYLLLTRLEVAYVAALFGGHEFRWYRVVRDPELLASIKVMEERFWYEHVQAKVPPAPRSTADLLKLWPKDSGKVQVADAAMLEACLALNALKRQIKAGVDQSAILEHAIKAAMADSAVLQDDCGNALATWKATVVNALDEKRLRAEYPDAYKDCLIQRPQRRFLLKPIDSSRVEQIAALMPQEVISDGTSQ